MARDVDDPSTSEQVTDGRGRGGLSRGGGLHFSLASRLGIALDYAGAVDGGHPAHSMWKPI
jgi:hypothetical protein